MFILPSGVITKIEAMCRNFLWDGGVDFIRSPLVSWEKACRPHAEGGLGLRNDSEWNKAAVGKLVWWIASKADHLWVRWVNHTYIKGKDWMTYEPNPNASWYWRRVCKIKNILQGAYSQKIWHLEQNQSYTIAKGYDFIRKKGQKADWHVLVWNKWSIPKHSFMAWVYHHKNMNTMDKMVKLSISDDDTCWICRNKTETVDHLFFECAYSRMIIAKVGLWLGIVIPHQELLRWRLHQKWSKVKGGVVNASINACVYHLWIQRNKSRFEAVLDNPDKVAKQIIGEIERRMKSVLTYPIKNKDIAFCTRILGEIDRHEGWRNEFRQAGG